MKSSDPTVTERRKVREAPTPHFRRVAKIWSAILGYPVSAEQVVLCMVGLKLGREAGAHEPDNITDLIGYASLIREVMEVTEGPVLSPGDRRREGEDRAYAAEGFDVRPREYAEDRFTDRQGRRPGYFGYAGPDQPT